jgi:uncharacterized membrane protein
MRSMNEPVRRPLHRWERALAYGVLGWAMEVAFNGVRDGVERSSPRLIGHSYLWMLPIYGLSAYLFEPLHDALRRRPVWQRATAYAVGISAVEYAAGSALHKAIGVVPWDYTGHGPLVLPGGATRLDYAPLWGIAGLGLERVHDVLRDARLRTMSLASA